MKTNKVDTNIKEKFGNRTFKPSASAWERLSAQLDEQEQKKKKGWFFYIGYAASLVVLISVSFWFFSDNDKPVILENSIVKTPIDTLLIDKKTDRFINEIPVEEAIVNNEKVEEAKKTNKNSNAIANKVKQSDFNKKLTLLKTPSNYKDEITNVDHKQKIIPTKKESKLKKESFKQDANSTIKINSDDLLYAVTHDKEKGISTENKLEIKKESFIQAPNSIIKINSADLLYAVTHSKEEVKTYYAKYTINRNEVLKTIRNQLKESNLKVNPTIILAEVERNIDEAAFQNNFMKSLKKRVTDIASAIASRND
ncbi:hypothetical protein BTO04_02820 [Polaribacter sp. SA4-10]|uniref:hypothetical protein n=1 Tax=Polaribacter sp. SA4-10 TaxID=754397 RepID=UPI000B3D35B4|nr:hypothetical protein [Polaribacter sp. SA4-10]ARV05693.1 hypothetical protein BTO04_02820 [Polaribacter sp. SA4-10]